jgi:GNAT superfamily N-acetyltransferase
MHKHATASHVFDRPDIAALLDIVKIIQPHRTWYDTIRANFCLHRIDLGQPPCRWRRKSPSPSEIRRRETGSPDRGLIARHIDALRRFTDAGAKELCFDSMTETRSRVGRLYSIATHPIAQGRGVGRALLQTCEAEAALRGCRGVSLEVRVSNTPAITFYERHGYRVVEALPGFYEDGANAIRMCKHVS